MADRNTVVLLHGLLGDERIWRHQIDALESHHDVVVPVYRSATRLEEMARVALDAFEGVAGVVGHSMGARVALEMWRAAPERISRLALFDFWVGGVAEGEREKRAVLTDLSRDQGIEAVAKEWVASMVHPDRRDDAQLIDELEAIVCTYTPEQHAGQIEALLHRRELWDVLETITVPTLIGVGRQDPWRNVAQHQQIAAAIRGARLEVIEDCGHMSPNERPEAVSDLLVDWFGG